ncbi:MAG: hypothetical protein M0Z61_02620 [Nitrospiraceae bacterium]|nr:hypothetical protein [Nitrospiraceae bacterium]
MADYAICNDGHMPGEKVVCKFGHKLIDLMTVAETFSAKHNLELEYVRPTSAISTKIIRCLDAFADARRGRYANFGSLDNPNLSREEPIRKWWDVVAQAILQDHYYDKPVQRRVEARARLVDKMMSPFAIVRHTNEAGKMMEDVLSASIRTGQTEIVQRYGRYHTLTIVRWLSEIFSNLANSACYKHGIDAFFGAWEYLETYRVDDSFLKSRKVWPLR